MTSNLEGGHRGPKYVSLTKEDTMICQSSVRCIQLLSMFALAITLTPVATEAQGEDLKYTIAACISSEEWAATKVLDAPAALNLSVAPEELQSIQTCADFCRSGSIPQGVGQPRGYSAFRPPYRYATLNNGRWCYCGNQFKGKNVERGNCAGKMNCLYDLESRCYVNTEPDHMVVDLTPPAGATGGGGGVGAGTSVAAPTTPPSASSANRRPNPPAVQPGGWEPPFPLRYEGAFQMAWRNNGDPDGDVLTFGLIIWQYDWTGRRWMQLPTIRDQYGTYGMVWLNDDNYTFTTQNGLSPQTHYAWMVFACDLGKGSEALCSWSGWSLFRTQ